MYCCCFLWFVFTRSFFLYVLYKLVDVVKSDGYPLAAKRRFTGQLAESRSPGKQPFQWRCWLRRWLLCLWEVGLAACVDEVLVWCTNSADRFGVIAKLGVVLELV